jgi:hypothetical protein
VVFIAIVILRHGVLVMSVDFSSLVNGDRLRDLKPLIVPASFVAMGLLAILALTDKGKSIKGVGKRAVNCMCNRVKCFSAAVILPSKSALAIGFVYLYFSRSNKTE